MRAPALLVSYALLTASAPRAGEPERAARSENLLAGPARCVLRYLDAVRLAEPRAPELAERRVPGAEPRDYAAARRLTAPRALADADRLAARGQDHPLAPWRDAARERVLESFQLVAARRAPRGAAVITVRERFWRPGEPELERTTSEYLVGRVEGQWRIVDRMPGGTFDDDAIQGGYDGYFDVPASAD